MSATSDATVTTAAHPLTLPGAPRRLFAAALILRFVLRKAPVAVLVYLATAPAPSGWALILWLALLGAGWVLTRQLISKAWERAGTPERGAIPLRWLAGYRAVDAGLAVFSAYVLVEHADVLGTVAAMAISAAGGYVFGKALTQGLQGRPRDWAWTAVRATPALITAVAAGCLSIRGDRLSSDERLASLLTIATALGALRLFPAVWRHLAAQRADA
jgi:hypothetical protein